MPDRRTTRVLRRGAVAVLTAAALALVLAPTASAEPSTTVTGRVSGDGRPLQGVRVEVVSPSSTGSLTWASAQTKRDGTYRMVVPAQAPAKAYVQFRAAAAVGGTSPTGYADKCAAGGPICIDNGHPTLQLNGTARVASAALGRAAVLQGRVTDSLGRGIGGLPVEAVAGPELFRPDRIFDTVTDGNGSYAFPRLNPYGYGVMFGRTEELATAATPAVDGYTAKVVFLTLTAGRRSPQDATLVGGGAITGRVVDQFGAPWVGATVSWYRPGRFGGWPETTTAADGSFQLRYLVAETAGLCARTGSTDTCPDGLGNGLPTTVREFTVTKVRIVMRRVT